MTEKAKSGRDAFTFSLRGLKTIASFAAAPAIADDRINKTLDRRREQVPDEQPDTDREMVAIRGRFWLSRRRRRAAAA